MISHERLTPDEYKNKGKGLVIEYGDCSSPFGHCFIATTHRGICKLAFFDTEFEKELIEKELHDEWQHACITHHEANIKWWAATIFTPRKEGKKPLQLLLKGSPFQIKVWEALLSIPENHLVAYREVARAIDNPKAVRAVATAIAQNNIAYLIPCHRVIRQNGDMGQYRWDKYRKQMLIAWEAALPNLRID